MDQLKGPQYRIAKTQQDSGVDLDALRSKLEKLHSVPQLKAGLNGKLSRVVVPETKAPTPEQEHEMGVKALAQCVAVAEGDWIASNMRRIFREDCITMSFNRRMKLFKSGELEPMRTLLSELEIEINHKEPEPDYQMPEGCILYRRLEIMKSGVVRGEMVWEWSRQ